MKSVQKGRVGAGGMQRKLLDIIVLFLIGASWCSASEGNLTKLSFELHWCYLLLQESGKGKLELGLVTAGFELQVQHVG